MTRGLPLPALLLTALLLITVAVPARGHGSPTDCGQPNIRCISNSRMTVALDLDAGGSIVRITDHANPTYPNLINHKDLGREAQIALRGAFVSREVAAVESDLPRRGHAGGRPAAGLRAAIDRGAY